MSRGLGNMQRAILAGLKPSNDLLRRSVLTYRGGRYEYRGGKCFSHGREFDLPASLYDLRGVLRLLATGADRWEKYSDPLQVDVAFQKSFSRASHGLVDRKVLTRYGWNCHPLRFVELADQDMPLPEHPWVSAGIERLEEHDRRLRAWATRRASALQSGLSG